MKPTIPSSKKRGRSNNDDGVKKEKVVSERVSWTDPMVETLLSLRLVEITEFGEAKGIFCFDYRSIT